MKYVLAASAIALTILGQGTPAISDEYGIGGYEGFAHRMCDKIGTGAACSIKIQNRIQGCVNYQNLSTFAWDYMHAGFTLDQTIIIAQSSIRTYIPEQIIRETYQYGSRKSITEWLKLVWDTCINLP